MAAPHPSRHRPDHHFAPAADEVAFVLADDRGRLLRIGVDRRRRTAFVERTGSGLPIHPDFPARHDAPIDLRGGRVGLRVFVDRSIVEVFADGGLATITDRFFGRGDERRWSLEARGGAGTLHRLDAWALVKPSAEATGPDR